MKRHHISFKHAWDGIVWVFKTQPNFRFHTLATVVVLIASWYFRVSYIEFLIISFTIMMVIIAEMINTAIEAMTDLISTQVHTSAKIAKDVSAGMVFMTAIFSVAIGFIIFLPHLSTLFGMNS